MSVSSRDTKAAIYAELERFRELADQQRNNIRALECKLEDRDARIAVLERQLAQPRRPRPTNFEARRQAAIELCKQLGVSSVTKDQVDEYLAA